MKKNRIGALALTALLAWAGYTTPVQAAENRAVRAGQCCEKPIPCEPRRAAALRRNAAARC